MKKWSLWLWFSFIIYTALPYTTLHNTTHCVGASLYYTVLSVLYYMYIMYVQQTTHNIQYTMKLKKELKKWIKELYIIVNWLWLTLCTAMVWCGGWSSSSSSLVVVVVEVVSPRNISSSERCAAHPNAEYNTQLPHPHSMSFVKLSTHFRNRLPSMTPDVPHIIRDHPENYSL